MSDPTDEGVATLEGGERCHPGFAFAICKAAQAGVEALQSSQFLVYQSSLGPILGDQIDILNFQIHTTQAER